MSVLEFSVYTGFKRWKLDFQDKFIKHLVTRPWSPVQVVQWSKLHFKKPRDQTWEDDKLRGPSQKSVESYGTKSYVQLGEKLTTRAHMQEGEDLEDLGTDTTWRRRLTGPKWAQAIRPRLTGPTHSGAQSPPLWPSHHSDIGRRGAEKRGTPSRREEGRAS
jgi:hypothetical protein